MAIDCAVHITKKKLPTKQMNEWKKKNIYARIEWSDA